MSVLSRLPRWRLAPAIVSRRIAGEHLLVPVRHGAAEMDFIYTVNGTGSLVCDLLDGGRTADDLATAVGAAYGISTERARRDVGEFLEALRGAGLAIAETPAS
jgi:hypothetical protein